jgi:Trypsin-co-occurring domain 1
MPFVPTEVTVGNQRLYIEVTEAGPPAPPAGPTTAGPTAAEQLKRIESAGEAAGEACVAFYHKLTPAMSKAKPDEVTVEFGLTLGGEAGIPFVAKGTVEASFKVSATWKFNDADQPATDQVKNV